MLFRMLVSIFALSPLVPAEFTVGRRSSSSNSYGLYAYGDSIGGFPMFYADGEPYQR